MDKKPNENGLDLVWGVDEIAKLIGRSRRQAFYLCQIGQLPAKKVAGRWVAKREALVRFFDEVAA